MPGPSHRSADGGESTSDSTSRTASSPEWLFHNWLRPNSVSPQGQECEREKVRLFLRLTTEVSDRLRTMMRHHGEISRYINEALSAADLEAVELRSDAAGRGRRITAAISHSANDRLRSAAKRRGCTVAALANSVLKQWLGGKRAEQRAM